MTTTLNSTDPRIVSFYNFINSKPKNDEGYFIGSKQNAAGLLYVIGGPNPLIQVWLPSDLLDYANAAAGTSGDRAVGIRVGGFASVKQAAEEILRIFSSPDALAKFINSSECDFTSVTGRAVRSASTLNVIDPMASDEKQGFWSCYNKNDLAYLRQVYGRELVKDAYNGLTMSEFKALFGLNQLNKEMVIA